MRSFTQSVHHDSCWIQLCRQAANLVEQMFIAPGCECGELVAGLADAALAPNGEQ